MLENEDLAPLIDQKALAEFRERALSPNKPVARGMAENPDHFSTRLQDVTTACSTTMVLKTLNA